MKCLKCEGEMRRLSDHWWNCDVCDRAQWDQVETFKRARQAKQNKKEENKIRKIKMLAKTNYKGVPIIITIEEYVEILKNEIFSTLAKFSKTANDEDTLTMEVKLIAKEGNILVEQDYAELFKKME